MRLFYGLGVQDLGLIGFGVRQAGPVGQYHLLRLTCNTRARVNIHIICIFTRAYIYIYIYITLRAQRIPYTTRYREP